MTYVVCDVITGTAGVIEADELDAVEWVPIPDIARCVPYGLFEPVRGYLGGGTVIADN
jgi:8-oxo-dGTP diphosphatase